MSICESVDIKMIAEIQYCTACPILRGHRSKLWKYVNTSPNVSERNDTADSPATAILHRRDLVEKVIGLSCVSKR